jgi:membrane-associated phospholipid phosphatase
MVDSWKKLVRENNYFFIPYFLFLLIGFIIIILVDKSPLHLFLNSFHNSFFDSLFYYITFLGDGITATIITLLLILIKYRYALITGISCLLSATITQLLKHFVFADALRPAKFFEGLNTLHLVENVENYSYNSFPSGHSTIAFALCTSFLFTTTNKGMKLTFFLAAILIAYSRVYLSQHFFEDIYVGSIIGCLVSCGIYFLFNKVSYDSKLNYSLLDVFRK